MQNYIQKSLFLTLSRETGHSDEVLTSRVCPHSAASDIRLTLWFDEVADA